MKRLAVALLAMTAGCEACPDYGDAAPLRGGDFRGVLSGVSPVNGSSFPAVGAEVTATVDRDAGTLVLRWTAADGGVVVETRRMVAVAR